MAEQPSLFDFLPQAEEVREEPWWVRDPQTPTDVARAKLWRGKHPLSGVASTGPLALHADESLTCGGCVFFERHATQGEGIWPRPKCVFGANKTADGRVTAAPRYLVPAPGQHYPEAYGGFDSDLEPWFRACPDHQEAARG